MTVEIKRVYNGYVVIFNGSRTYTCVFATIESALAKVNEYFAGEEDRVNGTS